MAVSMGVIVGLIWIGFAAHHPRTAAIMAELVERIPMPRHPHIFIVGDNALQQSITRDLDITPGEELTGYS